MIFFIHCKTHEVSTKGSLTLITEKNDRSVPYLYTVVEWNIMYHVRAEPFPCGSTAKTIGGSSATSGNHYDMMYDAESD